jgi:hypothetical protein
MKLFLKFFLPKIIVKFRCALYLYEHYTRLNTVFVSYKFLQPSLLFLMKALAHPRQVLYTGHTLPSNKSISRKNLWGITRQLIEPFRQLQKKFYNIDTTWTELKCKFPF